MSNYRPLSVISIEQGRRKLFLVGGGGGGAEIEVWKPE